MNKLQKKMAKLIARHPDILMDNLFELIVGNFTRDELKIIGAWSPDEFIQAFLAAEMFPATFEEQSK